jgi:CubicO group peptidase (beta-lactamase class C family)
MDAWQIAAIDYIQSWLGHQMRVSQLPGCIVAVAHRDKVVAEFAFGHASLATGEKLTPRHRFRIASHSKSFTAAGLMKLREQRKLRLDDPVGDYVSGLHEQVAQVTIGQLLSHSAGLTRDGADSGQFTDDRAFLNTAELMAELQMPPAIDPGARLKYSNHGYALLGRVIEAITGEAYRDWIAREVVAALGLAETEPDMPLFKPAPLAQGHTPRLPLERRLVVPGDTPANAMMSAAGLVSTAADVARFFAQLAPHARRSLLSAASRREMTRRHWRNPHAGVESYYGLGIMSGSTAGWDWFGHTGKLHGYVSRTLVVPACDLTFSIFTNASDGWAEAWGDGVLQILRTFATHGAPQRPMRDWSGRWWSAWGATDLVPLGDRVLAGNPQLINPFADAAVIAVTGRDSGLIAAASGYASHGEAVRRVRNKAGKVTEVWLGGARLRPEKALVAVMERRFGSDKAPKKPRQRH